MQAPRTPGFDNRFSLGRGRRHLSFRLGGMRILYAYIRKNGSSTFRAVMNDDPDVPGPTFAKAGYFAQYDARIFVWRDPEERLLSLYRDQILDGHRADDLVARYWQVMGEPPSTFERFARFATTNADPHVVPQRHHLRPIRYTHAIELRVLHRTMVDIVGPVAAEAFRVPRNVSNRQPVPVTPYARALIHRHYACDYAMIEKIAAAGEGEAAPALPVEPAPAPRFPVVQVIADDFRFCPPAGADRDQRPA